MPNSLNRQAEERGKGKGAKGRVNSLNFKVRAQGAALSATDHDFYTKHKLVSRPLMVLTSSDVPKRK